jgi:hypothetical protein
MVHDMAQSPDDLITVKEAARLARKHPNTIKRWARAGFFSTIKPGGTPNSHLLIDRASFLAYLQSTAVLPSEARLSQKPRNSCLSVGHVSDLSYPRSTAVQPFTNQSAI